MFEKDKKEFDEKILPIILSFMPAYRLHGESKIQSVAKKWSYYLSDQKLQSKKTAFEFEKSIESCRSPEEALLILCDFGLYSHCRVWQLIYLASLHPRIAKEAIDAPFIREKYPFFLPDLASRHVELAHYVVTLAETNPISLQDLVKLGRIYSDVGWRLLNTPHWRNKLQGSDLAELGNAHLSLASYILNSSDLADKLVGGHLAKLTGPHTASMSFLLDNPNFVEHLLSTALFHFDKIDFLFAHEILNRPAIASRLNYLHLLTLAKAHVSVARRILKSAVLLTKMQKHSLELAKFGSLYEEVALAILQKPALCESIADHDLPVIARNHFSVAQAIFATPALRARILKGDSFWDLKSFTINDFPLSRQFKNEGKGYGLAVMGANNAQTAHKILTTADLYKDGNLTGKDLAMLGASSVNNGRIVLDAPYFNVKLNGDNLETLGISHPYLAYAMFRNPFLLPKLSGKNLAALGESDAHVALYILKTQSLFIKLNGEELLKLTGYFKGRTKAYESYHIGVVETIMRHKLESHLMQRAGDCGVSSTPNEQIVDDLENCLRLSDTFYRIANDIKAEQTPKQSLPRP